MIVLMIIGLAEAHGIDRGRPRPRCCCPSCSAAAAAGPALSAAFVASLAGEPAAVTMLALRAKAGRAAAGRDLPGASAPSAAARGGGACASTACPSSSASSRPSTGLPCLTCGATRALGDLVAGDLSGRAGHEPAGHAGRLRARALGLGDLVLLTAAAAPWPWRPRPAAGARRCASLAVVAVARQLGLPGGRGALGRPSRRRAETRSLILAASHDERPHISVVIPVYNEAENVADLHRELTASLEAHGPALRDPARGRRLPRRHARAAAWRSRPRDPRVRVLRLRRNFGQTAAFSAGLRPRARRRRRDLRRRPAERSRRHPAPRGQARRGATTWSAAGAARGRTRSPSGCRRGSRTGSSPGPPACTCTTTAAR